MVQVVDFLSSKLVVLSSKSNTANKKNNKKTVANVDEDVKKPEC
jgi:hypothetical protein